MNDSRYLSLMTKARTLSRLGVCPDHWHGYQRGLRRAFQGELFGIDEDHKLRMRLEDDGDDKASRERGRGYRDGLSAFDEPLITARIHPVVLVVDRRKRV